MNEDRDDQTDEQEDDDVERRRLEYRRYVETAYYVGLPQLHWPPEEHQRSDVR